MRTRLALACRSAGTAWSPVAAKDEELLTDCDAINLMGVAAAAADSPCVTRSVRAPRSTPGPRCTSHVTAASRGPIRFLCAHPLCVYVVAVSARLHCTAQTLLPLGRIPERGVAAVQRS